MILDLFKKKEPEANKPVSSGANSQPAPPTLPPINKPGAPTVSQPTQNVQIQSSIVPPPISATPASNIQTSQSKPSIQSQAQSTVTSSSVNGILPSSSIDPYIPQIVDKVKNEFKDLKNEADKLKEVDFKLTQTVTTVKQFKDFMDDIQKRMEGIEKKAEQFSVALYELTTNEFNPFIAKAPPDGEVKIITPEKTAMIITPKESEIIPAQAKSQANGMTNTATINNIPKEALENSDIKKLIEENFKSLAKTMQQPPVVQQQLTTERNSIVQETPPVVIAEPKEEIKIHDPLANKTENLVIKKQIREDENKFIENMKSIPLGQNAEYVTPPEYKRIREKIIVEDVLSLPPENSPSKEVSEKISFEEIWNEAKPEQLKKEQPTLHKSDIKEILDKFMQKHREEKERQEQEEKCAMDSRDKKAFFAHKMQESDSKIQFEEEKKRIYNKKIINPKEYFWFSSGHLAKSIPDLIAGIEQLDDNVIRQHFTNEKNDFANWIRYTFKSNLVADALQKCKTKAELIKILS
ncbi:MAG: hypothetical protein QXG00_05360 [Candidatus Woesearchaeota archaeon]